MSLDFKENRKRGYVTLAPVWLIHKERRRRAVKVRWWTDSTAKRFVRRDQLRRRGLHLSMASGDMSREWPPSVQAGGARSGGTGGKLDPRT
ncbi:uncharacterized protein EKO05_0006273 [Ascochyta rabiei]|uniref:uncharacterized protein n=1 Tax=Didymella rabiei TaxID=5454 RepID=UPI00220F5D2E|nr:uncharacterized protein EKO05_0006273 [Ascochyta rabiei]UPX15837.1 hypothetical protein EKO05_0006273 [Ascochyta rabiei]